MIAEAEMRARAVRERLARVRELRRIMRDAPDQLRRDDAIVSYSRTLDSLVDDLMALDDMGLLDDYLRRADPDPPTETPPQSSKPDS